MATTENNNVGVTIDSINSDMAATRIADIPGFVSFKDAGPIDVAPLTNAYEVHGYVEDRLAGVTITESIWSGITVNSSHISRNLTEPSVRAEVDKFFTSRALRSVLPAILGGVATWRVGGYRSNVPKVLEAVTKKKLSQPAASVVMEIIMPALLANELVVPAADTPPIMNRFTFPFVRNPNVEDLAREVARVELERAIIDCTKAWRVKAGSTYSVAACAEELASAFFPIGRALRTAYDYGIVFSDMAKAVRARIDPECAGLTGDIPKSIMGHRIIDELMYNATFIRAALAIGATGTTASIAPESSEFAFNKWADAAIALLKASDRFAFRGRADALRNFGIRHVEDLRGFRRATVIYEHAKMEAKVLAVVAMDDDLLPDAKNIDDASGQIASHLAGAYGSVCDTYSVKEASQTLVDMLRHYLEMSEEPQNVGVFTHFVRQQDMTHIAMLLSDRILYSPSAPSEMIFCLTTDARVELSSGVLVNNYMYTCDPAEVVFAAKEIADPVMSEPLPQLLPRAALGAHLFSDAKYDMFIRSGARFSFNQTIGASHVHGSIRLMEFESARSDIDASLVMPVYNDEVYRAARAVFEAAYTVITNVSGGAALQSRLKREFTQAVVRASRGVASAFRAGIYSRMKIKTLNGVAQADVRLMGAQLNRDSVRAFADSFATAFFLAAQGIGVDTYAEDGVTEKADQRSARRDYRKLDRLLTAIWNDSEMAEELVMYGTDHRSDAR